ncbi:MAG: DUF4367 domain-containing protein [Lachnospiraceae bacterium]|nr:DUF4367 domain-containing protein [Lachnospiraceae bacterium]
MSRIEITDEWLEKYMPLAGDAMLQELEENMEEEDYDFSPEFEKKMERLIKKESHGWLGGAGKFIVKVAVAVLCVLGLSLAVTMSVDAYRTKFFQTAQELWEDSVIHTYFSGDEEQSFVPQEPAYVPEGYVEVSRYESEDMLNITYENAAGEWMVWDQMLAMNKEIRVVDAEYETLETMKIKKGVLSVYTYSDGFKIMYYEYNQYIFTWSGYQIEQEDAKLIFDKIK